jgi:peptide/nickel transport system substrate-binding protein
VGEGLGVGVKVKRKQDHTRLALSSPSSLAGIKLLLIFAVTAILSGCIGQDSSSPRRDTTLVIASQASRVYFDPAFRYSFGYSSLLAITNDGLVGFRREAGPAGYELVPDLATSIPAPTDGGRTWQFHMRSGIRYSTGQPVMASDVRRGIERSFALRAFGRYAMNDIVGAADCLTPVDICSQPLGISTDDSTGTITFHLTRPDPEFPYKLALPISYPVPQGTADVFAADSPLPATGPYQIASYQPGSRLVLIRNPYFHVWSAAAQPNGYANKIVVRLGLSQSEVFDSVESGEASSAFLFSSTMSATQLATLERRTATSQIDYDGTFFLFLKTRVPPFDHLDARRALQLSIDRQRLARDRGPEFETACSLLPPSFPGSPEACPDDTPDIAAAKKLVIRSGTKGAAVSVAADPLNRTLAEDLVRVLDRIGYRATLWQTNDPADSRNRAQVGLVYWHPDIPSPSGVFSPLLSCQAFIRNSQANTNLSGFCNPGLDAAVRRAVVTGGLHPATAADLWSAVDQQVAATVPVIPLYRDFARVLVSRSARNVTWSNEWGMLFSSLRPN